MPATPLLLILAGSGGGSALEPANRVVLALRDPPTHLDPRIGPDRLSNRLDYAVLPRELHGYRNHTGDEWYSLKRARLTGG